MDTGRDGVAINSEHLVFVSMHRTLIFPESTANSCVISTNATANTWSDWVEIADDQGSPETLTSKFAANRGHLSALCVEQASINDATYMVEIAYGAAKECISAYRLFVADKTDNILQVLRFRGCEIPAGEAIYVRAMCSVTDTPTLTVHFRYFLH